MAREVQRKELQEAMAFQLNTRSQVLTITRDEELYRDVMSLLGDLTNSILGTHITKAAESDEDRYHRVFGEVSEDDVKALNQHLGEKAMAAEQMNKSKAAALSALQEELSRKFHSRIK